MNNQQAAADKARSALKQAQLNYLSKTAPKLSQGQVRYLAQNPAEFDKWLKKLGADAFHLMLSSAADQTPPPP